MVDATSAPPASPVAQEPVSPALTPTQQRIIASFQLGWKLEELAGVCRLQDPVGMTDQPGFPPDLPTAQLQQVQLLIQELHSLLSLLGIPPLASGNGSQSAPPAPDLIGAVQSWIDTGVKDPAPILTALGDLDTMITSYLVTQEPDSAPETAYELGKALSLTYWDVAIASEQSDPQVVIRSWSILFASERIDVVKRHLALLCPIFSAPNAGNLNPKAQQIAEAMPVVSHSLEYWRNTLLQLDNITGAAHHHPSTGATASAPSASSSLLDPAIQRTLATQPDVLPLLLSALQAQQALWYDVLTGRQAVESLCPTGILVSLAEDMLGHTWQKIWHLTRRALPLLAGLFLTIGLLGVLVALGVVVLDQFGAKNTTGNTVASVLTVLGGGVTYVAAVGAALMRRGRAAASAAEVQAERVTATAQQTTREMVQATGPLGAQTALLVHEGLDNIIEQITQEEYTVMVTLPLVKFVLQRTNQRTGDPLQDATAFLRLVYGGRSNFERLLAIFPEMYVAAAISG